LAALLPLALLPLAPLGVRGLSHNRARQPPLHDISVDDEAEIDLREHDWRFKGPQSLSG